MANEERGLEGGTDETLAPFGFPRALHVSAIYSINTACLYHDAIIPTDAMVFLLYVYIMLPVCRFSLLLRPPHCPTPATVPRAVTGSFASSETLHSDHEDVLHQVATSTTSIGRKAGSDMGWMRLLFSVPHHLRDGLRDRILLCAHDVLTSRLKFWSSIV
jgi:hypothetical protein